MGKGAWLFLKRWVGLTRNGDDRKTQDGRSAVGAAVGVAEENTVVWDNSMTPASPVNRGAADVPVQPVPRSTHRCLTRVF